MSEAGWRGGKRREERTIDGRGGERRGEQRKGEERRGERGREGERLKKEGRRKMWKYM